MRGFGDGEHMARSSRVGDVRGCWWLLVRLCGACVGWRGTAMSPADHAQPHVGWRDDQNRQHAVYVATIRTHTPMARQRQHENLRSTINTPPPFHLTHHMTPHTHVVPPHTTPTQSRRAPHTPRRTVEQLAMLLTVSTPQLAPSASAASSSSSGSAQDGAGTLGATAAEATPPKSECSRSSSSLVTLRRLRFFGFAFVDFDAFGSLW